MSTSEPVVSVVVPVRNVAENIAPLLAEIAAALDGRWPLTVPAPRPEAAAPARADGRERFEACVTQVRRQIGGRPE